MAYKRNITFTTHPKGFLIAIGGAEDKGIEEKKETIVHFHKNGTLKSLLELISKYDLPRIEIISTASPVPEEQAKTYKAAFKKLDCLNVGHLNIRSRAHAENKNVLTRLQKANCVFFTGGDQSKLCSILSGTPFLDIIKSRYH